MLSLLPLLPFFFRVYLIRATNFSIRWEKGKALLLRTILESSVWFSLLSFLLECLWSFQILPNFNHVFFFSFFHPVMLLTEGQFFFNLTTLQIWRFLCCYLPWDGSVSCLLWNTLLLFLLKKWNTTTMLLGTNINVTLSQSFKSP